METHFDADPGREADDGSDPGAPSAAQARDTLAHLDADGARLAERVVTPWWYHLVLAVIVAVAVGSQALPGNAPVVVLPLVVISIPLLATVYNRRYGVSTTQPAGPRSRRLLFSMLGLLVVAMVAGLVVKLTGSPAWWVLIPAVISAVATIVLGRLYDDALRAELTGAASARR